MNTLKLYNYFRSSTSYRVRIALELKNLAYEYIPVHLVKNGGEQHSEAYRLINPMAGVPTLIHNDLLPLSQSSAIIDYLDEAFPQTFPLLPQNQHRRAKIREFSQIINSDSHALNNLRTTQYLENVLKLTPEQKSVWIKHWFTKSFEACEKILETSSGAFCFGDDITTADIFLIPHVGSALRFEVQVEQYPNVFRIYKTCIDIPAFKKAHPFRQIDTAEELRLKD